MNAPPRATRLSGSRWASPIPSGFQYRDNLREIVGAVVRGRMGRAQAADHVAAWVSGHIPAAAREQFREMVESELLGLHEGNFARYQVTPGEFVAWRQVWGG
ncbi:MAG TPA: hypothetical protein VFY29_08570 [Terriglobia bacterium]|nr:hypothetical protein [Terriglobia bacterium]